MKKLSLQFGISGSILGMLAGLVELSIGTQILPWIGNKESPVLLGFITLLLSAMAFGAIVSTRKRDIQTNDCKLLVFLGVLLPALICFTTVGRLWYPPGTLLVVTAALLAYEYWIRSPKAGSPKESARSVWAGRKFGWIGSLMILATIGLAFWNSSFGLFSSDLLVNDEPVRIAVLPVDFVRQTVLSGGVTTVEDIEVRQVMIVHILLILGAAIALIASLAASRLFARIGGGVVLLGLALFLIWLPEILKQANIPAGEIRWIGSMGWGWYLSLAGLGLILFASFSRTHSSNQPG